MKHIADTTYYKIDTEAFEYSPYAPVSKEKVKFVTVTRVINDRNGIHYLDAVDVDGHHWSAELDNKQEKWLVYSKLWTRDPQQPYDL